MLILLCWCKRYNIRLISFFSLDDLFLALICAIHTSSQINIFFEVKTFHLFFSFIFSPLSNGGRLPNSPSAFFTLESSSFCFFVVFYHLSLLFYHHPFSQIHKPCPLLDFFVYAMPVFFFNSLPNVKNSAFLTAATFSKCTFLGKTSLSVKHSCSPTFPDDKAEILAFCRSKSYWALFNHQLFWFCS